MNAELFAMLGGATRREEEGKSILSFKAGRMDPVWQPNGKYLITADPRRGQISLLFTLPSSSSGSSTLKFEWKDRRTRSVVESFTIIPEDRCTFAPISTGREGERVYLLQFGSSPDRRFFFWMQDKFEPGVDDKHCIDMNKFLSSVNDCIVAAGGEPPAPASTTANDTVNSTGSTADAPASSTGTSTAAASAPAPSSSTTTEQQQVDALSNILENLGMPQPNSSNTNTSTGAATSSSSASAPTTTPSANTSGGVLTLADLQGAMAGLATNSPSATTTTPTNIQHPTPPLTELVTSEAIEESQILSNPDVVNRLMEYLPENQRTEELLRENLRSPQVQQALHNLTSALVGDDGISGTGGMESYHAIIANFQLSAEDGEAAMASGNPIQAFLDCLLASVKRDKEKKEQEEEETKGAE